MTPTLRLMIEVQVYVALALQVTIAARMYSQGLQKKARFFFAYIIWQTFSTIVLYLVSRRLPPIYLFYGIWANDLVTISLGLAIIIELFNRSFEPFDGIRHFAKVVLFWSAVVFTLFGVIVATFRQAAFSVPALTVFMVAERSLRIVQLGLIILLFALSKYLHLRWKNYLFGIALGFGFYALMNLTGLIVRMYYGKSVAAVEDTLLGTAYCAAVLIWTSYVLQPGVPNVPLAALPSHELERWDRALGRLLGRA